MEIFRIVGVGLLTCIASIIIKQIKPEYYVIVLLSGGIVMLFMIIDSLKIVFDYFYLLVQKTSVSYEVFSIVLKILGVGYLCEFANGICVDSGNSSIGDKIILAGKVIILCLSFPIITSLLNVIVEFLP